MVKRLSGFLPTLCCPQQPMVQLRGTTEETTNANYYETLDFDATTDEYAHAWIQMPNSWDEGTLVFQFLWATTATTGNVIWGVEAVAFADNDTLDAAYGTAVTVTDGAKCHSG